MLNRIAAAALALSASLVAIVAHAQDVDLDALERDVTILAADDMEGREAGTRGHERAAGYVAGRFAAMGLEPAGDGGTYFQSVPMRRYAPTEDGNSLAIEGLGELELFEDYYVEGTAQQESGSITAPLVFIGYGLDLPDRDDFADVDLEGAVAIRVYGGPDSLNSEESAHFRSTLSKRLSDRGAVGMLLMTTPELEQIYSWDRLVEVSSHGSSMTWVGPDGRAHAEGPNILASGSLSPDLSRELLAGQEFDYDDLVAAEATPEADLPSFALGREITINFASDFADIDTPNVIGMLPGSDPAVADEYIVLTAHLDHVGIQPTPEEGDDEIFNGALDNAVGVASMIQVARMLGEEPPRRPVLVIALTAEEKGLLGSSYNAANPTVPAEQVVANVNLDMPVATYDFADVVAFGAERSNLNPQVEAAVEQFGLTLSPDPQPEQGFFTRSDQYSYVRRGVPAVYLDLGFANGGEEAQGLVFDQHYHEPSDEIDLVNFDALARFTAVNHAIARNVANMAETPAWQAGDFFGTNFGGRILGEAAGGE
ncbi:M28 family peptidase [Aurantiacibacter poecillastricola]|uniref:M28 family peptidase n=1 Tax=Aurantiacibacter poecillastricola TaxID=3064385 RepID=UPI00273F3798|nr:M28 family peptidase [Aurantiacibacter sp. 219JJ12-13]MDP5262524.1 M28 family peptidase [Aurantiacibacter sp. 219JJ12-13]